MAAHNTEGTAMICQRKPAGGRFIDLTGREYGKLTVESLLGFDGQYSVWQCKCKCGRTAPIRGNYLTRTLRPVTHCGCDRVYRFGQVGLPTYGAVVAQRNSLRKRGYRLCAAWDKSPSVMAVDVLPSRIRSARIEPIDPSNPVGPGNFRWVRHAKLLTCNGRTMSTTEWAKVLGVSRQCIHQRLQVMPPELALAGGARRPGPKSPVPV